ncbi:MAG: DUF2304 domain-containing protein [Defluviicoccus sp.]
MIKLLLLLFLVLVAIYVLMQRSTSTALRVAIEVLLVLGAYFVVAPQEATAVAHALGVGRGTDLILYTWIIVTFAVILVLYLKVVAMNRTITQLARSLALSHVRHPSTGAAPSEPAPEHRS